MHALLLAAATLAMVAVGAVAPTAAAQAPVAVPTPTTIAAPPGEDAVESGAADTDSGADQNPGLLLAVLVLPVVLVALIWMAYIFRLIFTEPEPHSDREKRKD